MAFIRVANKPIGGPVICISNGNIVDTTGKAMTSCTPDGSCSCNPNWWGNGTITKGATYVTVAGVGSYSDWDVDVETQAYASITIQLNPKYIGKSCTIRYRLKTDGRFGWSGSNYLRFANGNTYLVNTYAYAVSGSGTATIDRTDTFIIQNGTLTLSTHYGDTSRSWGPGAACYVYDLTVG